MKQLISNQTLGNGVNAGFCGDNAGIPQVFVAQFGGTPLQDFGECNVSLTSEPTREDESTDMTTTDNIIIGMMNPLESAVRDSIMENGNFSLVLIQVYMISVGN